MIVGPLIVLSAQELADRARAGFARTHTLDCACRPVELRAEASGLECASCGRRVMPRILGGPADAR